MTNKVLSTALILGSLYGTANASVSLTSPLYQASKGELKTEVSVGYSKNMWNKAVNSGNSTLKNKGGSLNLEGQYGLTDYIALNYGMAYDFTQQGYVYSSAKYKTSPEFTDYYLGLTGKLYDCGKQKTYITLNIGQNDNYIPDDSGVSSLPNTYFDLALKYGLDLNNYNVALSIGGRYDMSYNEDLTILGTTVSTDIKSTRSIYGKLENELTFGNLNLGLDLYYSLNDDKNNMVYIPGDTILASATSYNEYGINLNIDYALNNSTYLGLYGSLYKNDKETLLVSATSLQGNKREKGYTYGIKLTKSF